MGGSASVLWSITDPFTSWRRWSCLRACARGRTTPCSVCKTAAHCESFRWEDWFITTSRHIPMKWCRSESIHTRVIGMRYLPHHRGHSEADSGAFPCPREPSFWSVGSPHRGRR
jgi:hypothetical protein